MSFTKEDFFNLCYENKLKKIINGIEQFHSNQKELSYIQLLLQWFNEFENKNIETSNGIEELLKIQSSLRKELLALNPHLEDNISDNPEQKRRIFPLNIILCDIRSPYNTGSFFRIGDAFGVKKIYLCGITPTPEKNKKVLRTAINAEVDYEYSDEIIDVIDRLKSKDVRVIAVEKTFFSKDLEEFEFDGREAALIFGNEEFGLTKNILDKCDSVHHIKMHGIKNSLNVSVAGGVAINSVSRKIVYKK